MWSTSYAICYKCSKIVRFVTNVPRKLCDLLQMFQNCAIACECFDTSLSSIPTKSHPPTPHTDLLKGFVTSYVFLICSSLLFTRKLMQQLRTPEHLRNSLAFAFLLSGYNALLYMISGHSAKRRGEWAWVAGFFSGWSILICSRTGLHFGTVFILTRWVELVTRIGWFRTGGLLRRKFLPEGEKLPDLLWGLVDRGGRYALGEEGADAFSSLWSRSREFASSTAGVVWEAASSTASSENRVEPVPGSSTGGGRARLFPTLFEGTTAPWREAAELFEGTTAPWREAAESFFGKNAKPAAPGGGALRRTSRLKTSKSDSNLVDRLAAFLARNEEVQVAPPPRGGGIVDPDPEWKPGVSMTRSFGKTLKFLRGARSSSEEEDFGDESRSSPSNKSGEGGRNGGLAIGGGKTETTTPERRENDQNRINLSPDDGMCVQRVGSSTGATPSSSQRAGRTFHRQEKSCPEHDYRSAPVEPRKERVVPSDRFSPDVPKKLTLTNSCDVLAEEEEEEDRKDRRRSEDSGVVVPDGAELRVSFSSASSGSGGSDDGEWNSGDEEDYWEGSRSAKSIFAHYVLPLVDFFGLFEQENGTRRSSSARSSPSRNFAGASSVTAGVTSSPVTPTAPTVDHSAGFGTPGGAGPASRPTTDDFFPATSSSAQATTSIHPSTNTFGTSTTTQQPLRRKSAPRGAPVFVYLQGVKRAITDQLLKVDANLLSKNPAEYPLGLDMLLFTVASLRFLWCLRHRPDLVDERVRSVLGDLEPKPWETILQTFTRTYLFGVKTFGLTYILPKGGFRIFRAMLTLTMRHGSGTVRETVERALKVAFQPSPNFYHASILPVHRSAFFCACYWIVPKVVRGKVLEPLADALRQLVQGALVLGGPTSTAARDRWSLSTDLGRILGKIFIPAVLQRLEIAEPILRFVDLLLAAITEFCPSLCAAGTLMLLRDSFRRTEMAIAVLNNAVHSLLITRLSDNAR